MRSRWYEPRCREGLLPLMSNLAIFERQKIICRITEKIEDLSCCRTHVIAEVCSARDCSLRILFESPLLRRRCSDSSRCGGKSGGPLSSPGRCRYSQTKIWISRRKHCYIIKGSRPQAMSYGVIVMVAYVCIIVP